MKDLRGKIALVTGAASGIGRATSIRFSREGANLILVDIDEAGLERTARKIESLGGRSVWYQTDLRDAAQVEELHRKVISEVGTPDLLMNAAGVALVSRIEDVSLEDWNWVIGLNLWGYIHTLHYFLPDMIQKRQGHVVNVASGAGLFATPYIGAYSTSKFAVVGLTESLRLEANRYGIGVSAVCPGLIRTPLIEKARLMGFRKSAKKTAYVFAARPERLADFIVRGVKKNKAVIIYPFPIRLLYGLKKYLPRATDVLGKAIARVFYRLHHTR